MLNVHSRTVRILNLCSRSIRILSMYSKSCHVVNDCSISDIGLIVRSRRDSAYNVRYRSYRVLICAADQFLFLMGAVD